MCISLQSEYVFGMWEEVYAQKGELELSWHQGSPATSLELIAQVGFPKSFVDAGAGVSRLAKNLFDRGAERAVLIDLSASALAKSAKYLGGAAQATSFVAGNILDGFAGDPVELWHDRAVFHFLLDEHERKQYRSIVNDKVLPGGHFLIATFAEDGPEKCSGLAVRKHSEEVLISFFSGSFERVDSRREMHRTPWDSEQSFVYVLFRRIAAQS